MKFLEGLKRNLPIIFIVAIASALPIIYVLQNRQSSQVIDGFMGNWLATILGVITGIPIALGISRWQQNREEKRRLEEQQIDDNRRIEEQKSAQARQALEELYQKREHECRLLQALLLELNHNLVEINAYKASPGGVRLPGPADVLWETVCNNGETRWIEDISLLSKIVQAYLYIRTYIRLDRGFDNLNSMSAGLAVITLEPTPAVARLNEGRNRIFEDAKEKLRQAVSSIQTRLDQLTVEGKKVS